MSMSPLMRRAIERQEETGIRLDQSAMWRAYNGYPSDLAGVASDAVDEVLRLRAEIRRLYKYATTVPHEPVGTIADDLMEVLS